MIVLMLPHDMPETRTTMTLRKKPNPHFLFFTMIHLTKISPPVSWWLNIYKTYCAFFFWEKNGVQQKYPDNSPVKSTCFVRSIELFQSKIPVLLGKSSPETMVFTLKKGGFTMKIPSIESYIPRPTSPSAKALHSHL